MRLTGKEIIDFCDELLSKSEETVAGMCRATGLKKSVISMWRSHPALIPKLDTVVELANYFNMSVSELIGQEQQKLSPDILEFLRLEKFLTETEVDSVLAVARTFYNSHAEKKEKAM